MAIFFLSLEVTPKVSTFKFESLKSFWSFRRSKVIFCKNPTGTNQNTSTLPWGKTCCNCKDRKGWKKHFSTLPDLWAEHMRSTFGACVWCQGAGCQATWCLIVKGGIKSKFWCSEVESIWKIGSIAPSFLMKDGFYLALLNLQIWKISQRNLYAAANLDTLDFFALYSSTAALFGAAGWCSWVPWKLWKLLPKALICIFIYLYNFIPFLSPIKKQRQTWGLTMVQWCSFDNVKSVTGQGNYAAANTCILDDLFNWRVMIRVRQTSDGLLNKK